MIFNVVSQARGSNVGHSPLRGPKSAHETRLNESMMRERVFNGSRAYEIYPTTPHNRLGDPLNYCVIVASLLLASRPLAPTVRLSHVEIDSRCRGERETNTGDQQRQTTRVLAPSTLALVHRVPALLFRSQRSDYTLYETTVHLTFQIPMEEFPVITTRQPRLRSLLSSQPSARRPPSIMHKAICYQVGTAGLRP
jgi:hypothetical protein